MNRRTALALALLGGAVLSRPLSAGTAFLFPDPANGTAASTGTDGFEFQPNTDILVTALGYYDRDQDGLSLRHQLAIYDMSTGNQLASTAVGNGSGGYLLGLFQYNDIT